MFSKIKFFLLPLISAALFSNINSCYQCTGFFSDCSSSKQSSQDDKYASNSHVPDYEIRAPKEDSHLLEAMEALKIFGGTGLAEKMSYDDAVQLGKAIRKAIKKQQESGKEERTGIKIRATGSADNSGSVSPTIGTPPNEFDKK